MKLIQLIKNFRKWLRQEKRNKEISRCKICAYYGNNKYASFCCSCLNGIDDDYFTPTLKPISTDEFARMVIDHILGEDWHVTDSLSKEQILAIALDEILKKVKI